MTCLNGLKLRLTSPSTCTRTSPTHETWVSSPRRVFVAATSQLGACFALPFLHLSLAQMWVQAPWKFVVLPSKVKP